MSLNNAKVDLTNCDREPIHTPGSIQPHGILLVADMGDNRILMASANSAAFLGGLHSHVVGQTLSDLIGPRVAHDLRNALARSGGNHVAGAALAVQIDGGPVVDVSVHRDRAHMFVELEPSSPSGGEAKAALDLTQALVRRISVETDVETLAAIAAKLVRALLGYDRVMVYRFLHNGAGKVIAEAKRNGSHGFLGQYFPASDIPAQARRLYLLNWIRLIVDATYEPVPMVAQDANGAELDMSFAHLRSVSPIHCEYLRNMGVAASLSISIVVEGKLWGLIACHHDTPRRIPLAMRISAELFGQYFSLQVSVAERRAQHAASVRARERLDEIITSLAPDEPVDTALVSRLKELAALAPCEGAGLWLGNGAWHTTGTAPGALQAGKLVSFLNENVPDSVWSSDDLRDALGDDDFGADVAGVLAIPISGSANEWLMLFRSEEAHNISWAGEPIKQVVPGPHGPRLTPRGSFETWREDVRGRSMPWVEAEIAVAEATRNYLRDVILRYKEATVEERARADRRRRLLNDELNHRIKNIIALVKSLALQTGVNAATVADYSKALEGRLSALGYAHDQSLGGEGGSLAALAEAEASLHRFGAASDRVVTSGPAIGFNDRAFGVMALVLHELMTNAAKYGALSVPEGRLEISWRLDSDGHCIVDWTERKGPVVNEPERRGFGRTLIEDTITYDLGGQAALTFAPSGLQARIVVPARYVQISGRSERREVPAAVDQRLLASRTVLLVEDQALIAMDVEDILRKLGAAAVVSCPTVQGALAELSKQRPDVAVLDLNLGDALSTAVAAQLAAHQVPFVFMTGYRDTAMLDERFGKVPIVHKPISPQTLGHALQAALYSGAE